MIEILIQGYLPAFLFWLQLPLGALSLLLLLETTGRRGPSPLHRHLRAAFGTLPVLAVLFLPVLLGLSHLFPWVGEEGAAVSGYLNVPFFILRAVAYFGFWLFAVQRLPAAAALPLQAVIVTLASVDWMMSLEAPWISTIFGLIVFIGQALTALAFAAALEPDDAHSSRRNDLGNLVLALTMIWAYLHFSQFLVIWLGNLPEEVPWFLHRLTPGWLNVAWSLAILGYVVPQLLLLSRSFKRSRTLLTGLMLVILIARILEQYWLVMPSLESGRHTSAPLWISGALWCFLGYVWLGAYRRELRKALSSENL